MKNPMTTRSWIPLFLTLVSVQFAWAQQPPPGSKKLAFDQDSVGSPPAGFEFARTGQGAEGEVGRARGQGQTEQSRSRSGER